MRRFFPFVLAVSLALPLAACKSSTSSTDPQTPAADFQPTVPEGMAVYVNRAGQWYPARVVRQTGAATVLIHYEGTPPEYDEDVPFERVRTRPDAQAAAGDYQVGEAVLVTAQNRLYLAEVSQLLDGGQIRVRFTGFGAEAVDNVTPDRVQRPFTGATAFPAGTAVEVIAGGPRTYPGKVIAAVRADQWIVRLDGAGPEYDQIVGPDRIRALPAGAAPAPAASGAAPAPAAGTAAAAGSPPAPSATGAAPPAAPAAPEPVKPGDAVLLLVRTVYYPAKVVAAGANQDTVRIRVEGQAADEEVPRKQVIHLPDPLKGVKYKAGQLVYIEWHGVYSPGRIVKEADAGNYKVRGDGAAADELVNVKRLRPRD